MARVSTAPSDHWPEYLIEAAGLGLFMISACLFGALLGHPDSPIVRALPDPFMRRVLMGCAMGLTAVVLIYSSWGQRSGAHFNPATTLTFWRLGKVATRDAAFYVGGQTIGGLLGVLVAAAALRERLAHPSVRYVVTEPGPAGRAEAFVAEALITFILMTVVLHVSNTARLARFTGLCAGVLVAVYIAIEAPISGMSMNPARSLASAIPARTWTALWVYFTAPPLGMLAAAQAYVALCGRANVFCAKLHHGRTQRCIFRCRHAEMLASQPNAEPDSQPALSPGC
jgi:aquaporin Z